MRSTAATQRPSQQETMRQELQGIIKEMREKRMPVVTQLLARFDEVKMAPAAVVEAEAEVEVDVGDPRGSDSRRWLHLAGPGTVRAAARCPALDLRSRQHARR